MIFVTVGTHPGQFDRLIKRVDEIAPHIKEEIIIQRGFTRYAPKNTKYFDFTDKIITRGRTSSLRNRLHLL